MADIFYLLGQSVKFLFGFAIVGALLAFVYKRHAIDWERLAAVYGRAWTAPLKQKHFQALIFYSEGRPAKSYAGMLTIGLYQDGLGLRLSRILSPFHSPIFVPYTDIQGWQQTWYLNAKSIELEFHKMPEMRFIMPADQVDWIKANAPHAAIRVSDQRPPHQNWPAATFALAAISGLMAVSLISVLIFVYWRARYA